MLKLRQLMFRQNECTNLPFFNTDLPTLTTNDEKTRDSAAKIVCSLVSIFMYTDMLENAQYVSHLEKSDLCGRGTRRVSETAKRKGPSAPDSNPFPSHGLAGQKTTS